MVYLTDVLDFLDSLREQKSHVEVGAALQALAGLQMLEVLRLTWDKVDLKHGLIEISGEVKNVYRNRVIPVCSHLREILSRTAENARSKKEEQARGKEDQAGDVEELAGAVVTNPSGCSYLEGKGSWVNYSHAMRKAIQALEPSPWLGAQGSPQLPVYAGGHDGNHGELWEQYMGHAPRSVTGRHYVPRLTSVSSGQKDALEKQMNLFRAQVVDLLDEAVSRRGTAEILNFFEPRQNRAGA